MTYLGAERKPLDLSGLPDIVAHFQTQGVEAVAISFLHSYANPSHEGAALAELQRLWPEAPALASNQITREWREYERTDTAVLSAYVQPVAEQNLGKLQSGLEAKGLKRSPYIMQSHCGVDSLAARARTPMTMVESGPASGFWGAAELVRLVGEHNVLALDIGGTTAKCSLIENGQVRIMTDYWIERSRKTAGYPIMVPLWIWWKSAMAMDRSLWLTTMASSMSALNPPALCRARLPTAKAVQPQQPPMPISGWRGSTATISAVARSRPIWKPLAPPSQRWPRALTP